MPLTLDQLRVLDAIDRLGSFAAAAGELHRATSAVSYAVRALEDGLGLPLFDRTGHRAVLTPAGRLVLDAGRRLLDEAGSLEELAKKLRESWEPELRIVADGIFPLRPLMRALRRLAEEGAPTRVQLRVEYLGGVRERFDDSPAHLMLSLAFAGDAQHVARPLPPIEMLLLASPAHPLAGVAVDRRALSDHVELRVEDSSRHAQGQRSPLALGSPQLFRMSDFLSKRQALLEGVGYGWMPRHLVEEQLARGDLVEIGFEEGSRHVFTPHVVHRRTEPPGRAGRRFLAFLEEEVGARAPAPSSGAAAARDQRE